MPLPPSELAAADDGKPKLPPAKGVQAAAGVAVEEGSCISVIPTARSGSVTLRTTAGAAGYSCRRRKSMRLLLSEIRAAAVIQNLLTKPLPSRFVVAAISFR
ncbi:uncharacterized protein LOC110262908 [Arachis ipaensis]|uniref:uncharacterized protein LOC110262908 n=1 Tax=Arachis ipaensis TaxID=130454 RepID=UPI000A2B719C|nr:uncharacterized protein LOC110262908 [Arachis ipaensis]